MNKKKVLILVVVILLILFIFVLLFIKLHLYNIKKDIVEIQTIKQETEIIDIDQNNNSEVTTAPLNNIPSHNITSSIPILSYHNFMTVEERKLYASNDKYTMTTSQFEEQLKYLKDNGYNTITLNDFYRWYIGEIELSKKDVVIVIDDGNISSYYYAIPLIEKYGFCATIFVITGRINIADYKWEPSKLAFLDNTKINDIYLNHPSIKLESHSHHLHQQINGIPVVMIYDENKILSDIQTSKEILQANYFAYPYGVGNKSVSKVLQEVGYKLAFSFGGDYNGQATRDDDQYFIKRININAYTSLNKFKKYLN